MLQPIGTISTQIATPQVMGIINVNSESFYPPSRTTERDEVVKRFFTMLDDGADIIDLGACSTRPGSTPITQEEEEEYLVKPLKAIAQRWKEIGGRGELCEFISIDTFRSEVVRKVYDIIGPFMVNDISAGEDDPDMLGTIADLKLTYIAMHKRGTPATMQQLCNYPKGVVTEVIAYFKEFALKAADAGIEDWIIDPGFGFAKTVEQNYELLARLSELKMEGHKILVGLSRKSMIWKLLGITPEESLPQTTALNLMALCNGADIIRVHDVKEGVDCVKMYSQIRSYR